jgi:hypothetical protein
MLAEKLQEIKEFAVGKFSVHSVAYCNKDLVSKRLILVNVSQFADTLESIQHIF